MSYTYGILDISPAAFKEIRERMERAGYGHAVHNNNAGIVIDMHGIGLRAIEPTTVDTADEQPRWKRPAHLHQWAVQPGLLRFEGPDGELAELRAEVEVCLFCPATRDVKKVTKD